MMKFLLLLPLLVSITYAEAKIQKSSILDDVSLQGHIDLRAQTYLRLPQKKHQNNITTAAILEIAYAKDEFTLQSKFKAQQDYYDLQSVEEHNNRTYLRLDEFYAKFDFDDDQILFGKNVRFWGALEVRNITDGFNPDELRDDPFDMDKLGVWNVSFSHYTESGEITAIVKMYEQAREMSALPYVYYYFPESVNGFAYVYTETLKTQEGKNRPSIYLKYAASTDTEYALDYAVIFENGYDSQRYYTAGLNAGGTEIETEENAYLVNKLSTYNTLVVGATLLKLEAVYADVISDDKISDYYHIGLGVEHTLTQFYDEADLGLLVEYYKYGIFDKSKRSDLELLELFQNDLFLGARYTFNDANDASIVGGTILDLDYDEQVYYVEYETRVFETLKINLDYRYVKPSSDSLTAFHLMGKHERLSLQIGYYF